jgi:SAM-dependent methyltransferase
MGARFPDHFSGVAAGYARFRPRYPAALFDWLAGLAPSTALAWDCATGSGQAALPLAERFAAVVATDASERQIASAASHPRVRYEVAPAERSGLPPASADLITVAQALHWFDIPAFLQETKRVLRPGGVLAVWSYATLRLGAGELQAILDHFYRETVGPYWPPERRLVEDGYRSVPFPFEAVEAPPFAIHARLSLEHLAGYLRTWSATQRLVRAGGDDPVPELIDRLRPYWGGGEGGREVSWPLALRVGRHRPPGSAPGPSTSRATR